MPFDAAHQTRNPLDLLIACRPLPNVACRILAKADDDRPMDRAGFDSAKHEHGGSAHELEEDDTQDEFSKKMIRETQAAKWRADNSRPQAFRKARPRPRADLTLENIERVPAAVKQPAYFEAHHGPSSSNSSSSNSEPPLNVPRNWGRKARRNTDWLRRITSNTEFQEQTPKVSHAGELDWSDAADIPLPSGEDSPSSRPASRRGTPASVAAQRITSLVDAGQTNIDYETFADSILTSTPAMPRQTDSTRKRDYEETTTSATAKIYPTPPPEDYVSQTENAERPVAKREDSHDLLRRLARSASQTPSPVRTATGSRHLVKGPGQNQTRPDKEAATSRTQRISDVSRAAEPLETETPRPSGTSNVSRPLQALRSGKAATIANGADSRLTSRDSGSDTAEQEPKTPVVTGAWIQTPAPTRQTAPPEVSKEPSTQLTKATETQLKSKDSAASSLKRKSAQLPKPYLPASALSAIVSEARQRRRCTRCDRKRTGRLDHPELGRLDRAGYPTLFSRPGQRYDRPCHRERPAQRAAD